MDSSTTAQNSNNAGIQPRPFPVPPVASSLPVVPEESLEEVPSVSPPESSQYTEYQAEIDELSRKLQLETTMPQGLKEKATKMISRLKRSAKYGNFTSEYESLEKYIDWITQVPWGQYSQDNLDLKVAKEMLDATHYGLENVKDLILEYLAIMKMRTEQATHLDFNEEERKRYANRAPIVLFVGLQGVGKTSIAKSIAKSMNRQIVRISLGAMSDISQIRGTARTNANAEPGQLVKALIRAQTLNPIIILDEIDKVSGEKAKAFDMNAVLLEILDPEQNDKFLDYYLDYYVDLSRIMFVATANNLGTLSVALLDRLEVIRFTSYTDTEKMVIAKSYLYPKVLKASGLTENQLSVQDEVWPQIIRPLGYDSGIRQLERTLMGVCRKAARIMLEEGKNHIIITTENVKHYLPDDLGTLS
jgi:ATP-dependent Lon protease